MTQAQKTQLAALDLKYKTVGLTKAESTRYQKLQQKDAIEVGSLASKLSGWAKRHNVQSIGRDYSPVETVYVNSVL